MQKKWKRRMLLGAMIAGATGIGGYAFCQSAKFGALPEGEGLERLIRSPHCVDGVFQNELPTPLMVDDGNVAGTWLNFLFRNEERLRPSRPLPTEKEKLDHIDRMQDMVVWLGHSSFYLHLGGKRILIDPVLSEYASPVPFAIRAFPYSRYGLLNTHVLKNTGGGTGKDPSEQKRAQKRPPEEAVTFAKVAREWFEHAAKGLAPATGSGNGKNWSTG